uniref:Uncharacterized protein n=1 Tax=Cacopsylla melanoneura TaxID=428564 RepID=A0A8D9C066_9HEMI
MLMCISPVIIIMFYPFAFYHYPLCELLFTTYYYDPIQCMSLLLYVANVSYFIFYLQDGILIIVVLNGTVYCCNKYGCPLSYSTIFHLNMYVLVHIPYLVLNIHILYYVVLAFSNLT